MKLKKTIYLILSTFLFVIISYGFHAIIELIILNSSEAVRWYSHFGGSCALPPVLSYGLLIVGLISGFIIGMNWWRIVYIEKRHWRFKNKLNNKEDNQNE